MEDFFQMAVNEVVKKLGEENLQPKRDETKLPELTAEEKKKISKEIAKSMIK